MGGQRIELLGKIGDLLIDGFEPVHDVPVTSLDSRPKHPKKPKPPKSGHRDGQRSGEVARGHRPPGKRPNRRRRPARKTA